MSWRNQEKYPPEKHYPLFLKQVRRRNPLFATHTSFRLAGGHRESTATDGAVLWEEGGAEGSSAPRHGGIDEAVEALAAGGAGSVKGDVGAGAGAGAGASAGPGARPPWQQSWAAHRTPPTRRRTSTAGDRVPRASTFSVGSVASVASMASMTSLGGEDMYMGMGGPVRHVKPAPLRVAGSLCLVCTCARVRGRAGACLRSCLPVLTRCTAPKCAEAAAVGTGVEPGTARTCRGWRGRVRKPTQSRGFPVGCVPQGGLVAVGARG